MFESFHIRLVMKKQYITTALRDHASAERAQESEITARHEKPRYRCTGLPKMPGIADPSPYCPHGIPVSIRSRGI